MTFPQPGTPNSPRRTGGAGVTAFYECVLAWLRTEGDEPTAAYVTAVNTYGTDWAGDTEGGFYSESDVEISYLDTAGRSERRTLTGESMESLWRWVVSEWPGGNAVPERVVPSTGPVEALLTCDEMDELDRRAVAAGLTDGGEPNRWQMSRRLLTYALKHMPEEARMIAEDPAAASVAHPLLGRRVRVTLARAGDPTDNGPRTEDHHLVGTLVHLDADGGFGLRADGRTRYGWPALDIQKEAT